MTMKKIEMTIVSAIIMAAAKSFSKSEENVKNGGRTLSHKPAVLADFEAVCPNQEYAKAKFDEYIKGVSALHTACFELAKKDKGAAINKAIADYLNTLMGDIGHITAGSFAITRVAAKTVKDICLSFDKSSANQFRRALEVCLFNIAVEYRYADKPSLVYFKAVSAFEKNNVKLATLPGKIKMLEGVLAHLDKDTAEYSDINNQIEGSKKSLESAENKRDKLLTAYNEAITELDKAVKAGTGSMTAELFSDLERGTSTAIAAMKIVDKLADKAKAELEKKSA